MTEKNADNSIVNTPAQKARLENMAYKCLLEQADVGIVVLRDKYTVANCSDKAALYIADISAQTGEGFCETCARLKNQVLNNNEERASESKSIRYVCGDTEYLIGLVPFVMPVIECDFNIFFFLYIIATGSSGKKTYCVSNNEAKENLSDREWEVLALIAEGYRNREIAKKLSISIHTVKTHNEKIFRKLDVNNRIMAINKYFELVVSRENLKKAKTARKKDRT